MAPASNGISPVPPYLRTVSFKYFIFTYGIITLYDRSFQRRSVNKIFWTPIKRVRLPRNPILRFLLHSKLRNGYAHNFLRHAAPKLFAWQKAKDGLGFSAFARHYLRNLNWFIFLLVLRCFSSQGAPPWPIYSVMDSASTAEGCPIRKSPDQSLLNNSPRLIAASCVLHRFLMSRHPPYALVLPLLNLPRLASGFLV